MLLRLVRMEREEGEVAATGFLTPLENQKLELLAKVKGVDRRVIVERAVRAYLDRY